MRACPIPSSCVLEWIRFFPRFHSGPIRYRLWAAEASGGRFLAVGNPARGILRGPDGLTERHPLTHHEILRLVEPFTRRGRHVDLSATDRIERRLVFKPVVHGSEMPAFAGACEILQLENPRSEVYRLIRTLTLRVGNGEVDNGRPRIRETCWTASRLFRRSASFSWSAIFPLPTATGWSRPTTPAGDGPQPMRMVLTSAEARLENLTLALKAETGKGYPAEFELSSQPDDPPLDLPDDLLATLGWNWKVLRRRGTGWTGDLRVPRNEPDRSRRIEIALERTVAHLARTLSEPPRRFHERLVRERWTVVLRRMTPLLLSVALIAGGFGLMFVDIPQGSLMQMLILNSPPLLLVVVFGMRELPRFEIPPLPRPSNAPSWFSLREGQPAD